MDTTRPDDTSDWGRARELFLDLADLPAAERASRLEELRAEDGKLAEWVERLLERDAGPDESTSLPERFGPYEAVRTIAVGGMGEVVLARRSDGEFEREVAVKRLRGGAWSETLRLRFQRERETLARLDHEYIARLLDGGATEDGQPYLVLEYVDGRHIDDYCRAEGLGVRERVELFCKVAEAVGHAHEHGVIHRDLKPSNILIRSDGQPRLLDFGIARLHEEDTGTTTLTGTGQRLFTPEFASPEQVTGEAVTPATDVFALGVVLYHLLAEVGPWEGANSLHELERHILEVDPAPPSRRLRGRLQRGVAGDLDTIVLHCLDKRPKQRFESVAELIAELQRHLSGFPIRTRPTGAFERIVRTARRNPWQVLAATVFAIALVAGGSAVRSHRAAETRGVELIESLEASLEYAQNLGYTGKVREALAEVRDIESSLDEISGHDEFRLRVLIVLCEMLLRADESEQALGYIDAGLALFPEDESVQPERRGTLLMYRYAAYRNLARWEEAADALEVGFAYVQKWVEPGHIARMEAFEAVGTDESRPMEERLAAVRRGVAERRALGIPNDNTLSGSLSLEGVLLFQSGRPNEALAVLEEGLAIDRYNHGEGHLDVALARYLRAACLRALGRLEEARDELADSLATFERVGHHAFAERAWELLDEVEGELGALGAR